MARENLGAATRAARRCVTAAWIAFALALSAAAQLAAGGVAGADPGRNAKTGEKTEMAFAESGSTGAKDVITLGGGCFWCLEAVFDQVQGVEKVESGYAGGTKPNPSYEEVCGGRTAHAEVVQVTYDPKVVSLSDLLHIYFTIHDPTTRNRQGADVGTQYRSVILYRNPEQKAAAEAAMREIEAAKIWDDPIVTEVVPLQAFYSAEGYHQEYFVNNPDQPYCRAVIEPKVLKFREKFRDRLKAR